MAINVSGSPQFGTVFAVETDTVLIHEGARGPAGLTGAPGATGAQGASFNLRGSWSSGATYDPLDAVIDRASANADLSSLWIQNSDEPSAVSTLQPYQDVTRWSEVGATDVSNITGAIWTIYQIDHGFTMVGQPVAFSYQVNRWVLADNRRGDEVAIAVVKEVISADLVIVQTSGEIRNLDPGVIWPDGSAWEQGQLYYVHSVRGRVSLTPPSGDPSARVHPILIPTAYHLGATTQTGVAIPWKPDQRFGVVYRPSGLTRFYYTLTAGQTVIAGADIVGNVLAYDIGNVDVFLNGSNLSALSDFTAMDSVTVTLAAPAIAGDSLEIWTLADPAIPSAVSTAVKIDTIEPLIDGARTVFPLTYDGGVEALGQDTANVMIWLDGTAQEPLTDFNIVFDPLTLISSIVLTAAPMLGTRFWGLIGLPVGTITGAATINARLSALEDPTAAPNTPIFVEPFIADGTAIPATPGVTAYSITIPDRWRGLNLLLSATFQMENTVPGVVSAFRVTASGADINTRIWDISAGANTINADIAGSLVWNGVVSSTAGAGDTTMLIDIETDAANWTFRYDVSGFFSGLSLMPINAA